MLLVEHVKYGTVAGVGIHRGAGEGSAGEARFAAVEREAFDVTPVSGGVRPMNGTMLLYHPLRVARTGAGKSAFSGGSLRRPRQF
jgi:5,10-methylene-tetrahydrofolate dehydrogenase/methenyl tetrahydrofolate cyclohydrolase